MKAIEQYFPVILFIMLIMLYRVLALTMSSSTNHSLGDEYKHLRFAPSATVLPLQKKNW